MGTPIRASDRDLRAMAAIVSKDRPDLPGGEGLPPSRPRPRLLPRGTTSRRSMGSPARLLTKLDSRCREQPD
jgi:hypothetical protein